MAEDRPSKQQPHADSRVLAAHLISLALGATVLLWVSRHQWFFYDEWDLLAGRGLGGRPLDLFAPHNGHWSTFLILVFQGLYAVVKLHSYLPYSLTLIVLVVALVHLLWRIAIRASVDAWTATLLLPLLMVYGAGWQDLIWAFQIAWIASLAVGAGACLIILKKRYSMASLATVNILLIVGLMFSGIGIAMVATAGTLAFLTRGLRTAAATLFVPSATFMIWYATIGRASSSGFALTTNVHSVIAFMWTGLSGSVNGYLGVSVLGPVATLVIAAYFAVRRRQLFDRLAVPAAFVCGGLVFFFLSAVSRAQMGGSDFALQPRYLFVGAVFLAFALVFIASDLVSRWPRAIVGMGLVAVVVAISGTTTLDTAARRAGENEAIDRDRLIAAEHLIESGSPIVGTAPDPSLAPQLNVAEIRDFAAEGAFPGNIQPPPQTELDEKAQLQLALNASPNLKPGFATSIRSTGGTLVPGSQPGCFVIAQMRDGRVTVLVSRPTSFQIISTTGGPMTVTLDDQPHPWTSSHTFSLPAATNEWLDIGLSSQSIGIIPPPGTSTYCNVG